MICATAGIAIASLLPQLPPEWTTWPLVACAVTCSGLPRLRSLAAALLGLAWALYCGHAILAGQIPEAWEGVDVALTGTVVTLPREDERAQRFEFAVERVLRCPAESGDATGEGCWRPSRLLLSWYEQRRIRPGERWRFTVRLNRPHGHANPGSFDYEAWLAQRGIAATGYVRLDPENQRLASAGVRAPLHQLRYWLRQRIRDLLPEESLQGLLIALVIGESQQITAMQWTVLSRTGTNHLMVISGLHVGLVAGFVFRLVRAATVRIAPAVAALRFAAAASIVAAFAYGLLAGFGLPAQRAAIMVTVAMAAISSERRIPVSFSFCAALFAVTLIDPLAVRTTGFWLSFGSVFALLYVFAGRSGLQASLRESRGVLQWGWVGARAQQVLFVLLLPLLSYHVMQVPLMSPVANIVAVPWVSCLVVPPLLCAALLLPLSDLLARILLIAGDRSLDLLWRLLDQIATLNWIWFPPERDLLASSVAFAGALLLLAPTGVPGRWLGVALLLPLICPWTHLLREDEALITVLDVGQGLAVVAELREHTLLFDSGGYFSDRYDLGAAAVVPYLRSRGIDHLDVMVISHGETDHAGGAPAVVAALPVWRIISGSPARVGKRLPDRLVQRCGAGEEWRWGAVRVQILHPQAGQYAQENNNSCVLRIASGPYALLLPGDIERDVEQSLAERADLAADLLLAPHHGSITSSSVPFINAVNPSAVIHSAGYNSRFKHPHQRVVQRYRLRGVAQYITARDGALTILLDGRVGISISAFRARARRYWYAPSPQPSRSRAYGSE